MDLYDSFCRAVCAHIPRATAREREDIVRELTHHMEDHARQLTEGGTEAAAARAQAVRAMGDPVEIGTKWNRQLSPFWLWTGRVLRAAVTCLTILIAIPFLIEYGPNLNSILVRVGFTESLSESMWLTLRPIGQQPLELRCPYGDSVIYFYDLVVVQGRHDPEDRAVQVSTVSYHQNPCRQSVDLSTITYGGGVWISHTISPTPGVSYAELTVPLPRGERPESVTITGSSFGNSFQAVIPLDWEAIL